MVGQDLLERVRGLEFDEVRMQAAKYCHGSARSNSDRPATLAKSADVAKRGRPSVGGPGCGQSAGSADGPVIEHLSRGARRLLVMPWEYPRKVIGSAVSSSSRNPRQGGVTHHDVE
jgi:hypothetical protein